MFLPSLKEKGDTPVTFASFGGLDTRPRPSRYTMSFTRGVSSDAYPSVIPQKGRTTVAEIKDISAAAAPEYTGEDINSFTGAANGKFYYNGKKINGSLKTGEAKTIVDFNGNLCIFPDKLYYRYLPDPTDGSISTKLESMEKSVNAANIVFYSSHNSVTGEYTAYLQKSGAGFDIFSPGDSVIISGCTISQNNTCVIGGSKDFAADDAIISVVVKSASSDRLELLMYNKSGGKAVFSNTTDAGTVTVKTGIPDMDNVCVHNNRLWGTAENGEYIYASALGDFTSFNAFRGLGTDSWYSRVGTPGGFTGICSYRSCVVAFKQNCIHHIYGDSPQNYSIPKQTATGCIDGRSIAELGGILYYLSAAGFCAYGGGEPYLIAPQISEEYTACAAGADECKYYAAAYKKDGSCDLLVYDPGHNLWYREASEAFVGFFGYGSDLYGVKSDSVVRLNGGERNGSWEIILNPIDAAAFSHRGICAVWLCADAGIGTRIKVSVAYDSGDFAECANITATGKRVYRIPVRYKSCDSFRLKIEGEGYAVIHGLEIQLYQGGKTYAKQNQI